MEAAHDWSKTVGHRVLFRAHKAPLNEAAMTKHQTHTLLAPERVNDIETAGLVN
jgi:hypothetical protein